MTDAEVSKVRKLAEAWRVEHDKATAILEELETILSGGVSIGEHLKQAEASWQEVYQARYRSSYVWNYVKDRAQMKRLIKTLGVEELRARMARYLQNTDPFFVKARHGFGLFVSTIIQHARANDQPSIGDLALDSPVADCKHDPPCPDDRTHTRRRSAEMRGEAF